LDAFTSSMCVESWGRISFARALIEIDATIRLKKEQKKSGDTKGGTQPSVSTYNNDNGGGNQLEDVDSDFYEGYEDQVVDLHGALKEYRDFMLSMSGRK
nr:hypothetical protein [Tanacetum cinerariifolium]